MTPDQTAFTDTLISRTVRERIVLVGVTVPPSTQAATEAALDELARLVDTAGADVVDRVMQRRDAPDPSTYLGRGKAADLRAICLATDADTVVFDNDLSPGSTAQPRADPRPDGHRPHGGDPRHLRPERADARRAGSSGAGPSALPVAPPPRSRAVLQPTGRRHRDPGPGRDPARGGPSPAGQSHAPPRVGPPPAGTDPADPTAKPDPVAHSASYRWWATPTPASRRCSTACPGPTCWSRTACSRHSTPAPGSSTCPAGRRCCSPTRSVSCANCRTSWSSPSTPPSRWWSSPTSSSTWSTARRRISRVRSTPSTACWPRSEPTTGRNCWWSTRSTSRAPPWARRPAGSSRPIRVRSPSPPAPAPVSTSCSRPWATACGSATGWSSSRSPGPGRRARRRAPRRGDRRGDRRRGINPHSGRAGRCRRLAIQRLPGFVTTEGSRPAGFRPPPYPYARLDASAAEAVGLFGAEGVVDCSVGTPCDPPTGRCPPCPGRIRDGAWLSRRPWGRAAYRRAAADWLSRRFGVAVDPSTQLAACVGTKEFVASVAQYLRLRTPDRDTVLYPEVSYPTYAMGALLAGCRAVGVPEDPSGGLDLAAVDRRGRGPRPPALDELPVEPHRPAHRPGRGGGLGPVPSASRSSPTSATPSSPGRGRRGPCSRRERDGVVAVHSLSKRSNLAGARAGFYAGDAELVGYLADVRRHAGLMVPGPVQDAAVVAFSDDAPCRRAAGALPTAIGLRGRRPRPMPAGRSSSPDGGFYLWVPVPQDVGDGWALAGVLARRAGLLVSPGEFYGPAGGGFVRVGRRAADGAPRAGGRSVWPWPRSHERRRPDRTRPPFAAMAGMQGHRRQARRWSLANVFRMSELRVIGRQAVVGGR